MSAGDDVDVVGEGLVQSPDGFTDALRAVIAASTVPLSDAELSAGRDALACAWLTLASDGRASLPEVVSACELLVAAAIFEMSRVTSMSEARGGVLYTVADRVSSFSDGVTAVVAELNARMSAEPQPTRGH